MSSIADEQTEFLSERHTLFHQRSEKEALQFD